MTDRSKTKSINRRALLKGAGVAGLAVGSGAITGFPYVHAAEPKVLRYLGTAVNEGDEISKKCLEDTGIKIEYITATTDDVTKRVITQPNSFDVLDTEYFSLKKLVPSGNIFALDAKKIKEFDNITPVFTKGELPNGKKIGAQGTAPWKVLYLEGANSKTFSKTPTEFVTLIPTVYNADTLGIRPDLIKRSMGIPCTFQPLKEGYRSWASGFCVSKAVSGPKLDWAYEFVNWYLSGWAGAYLNRQGYYSAVLSTAKANMTADEWGYWMEGKAAVGDIKAPDGTILEKAGAKRDGGSYDDRMGAVACWNAVMDENDYMVRKWNEFIAA